MSKVAVKRPAQCRLSFDDDNNYRRQGQGNGDVTSDNDTNQHYDRNNNNYKKDIEVLIFAQLENTLNEEDRLFKKKWNYDVKNQKFIPGNYCWDVKSAISSFPHFYSYYRSRPLFSNCDEMWVEPANDSGTIVTPQTNTTTTNLLITTETFRSTTTTSSVRNTATTNICNENTEEADSLRLIPMICYNPRDTENEIIGRQRTN